MRETEIRRAVDRLAALPYQRRPYSARNWGSSLHSLCSFPSKLKPAIAHFLVTLFSEPGDVVYDPFAGCGTVPLEACLTGRVGSGSDLSPLGAILTAAKVGFPDPAEVQLCISELEAALESQTPPNSTAPSEIETFYHQDTFTEVLIARQTIFDGLEHADRARRAGWELVAGATLHLLHGNRPYALSRRSHNIIPIPPKGPAEYKPLMERLRAKLDRVQVGAPDETTRRGRAYRATATDLPVDDNTIDLVATSPPFLGTTDFLRQNRVRLWFAGWDYERQAAEKQHADFLEFQNDMTTYGEVFEEIERGLRPGGVCAMHLGVVKGFDMVEEAEKYATKAGLEPVGRVYEDAGHLESHGRTDRGATTIHAFLIAQKP